MTTIQVTASRTYDVVIGRNLLVEAGSRIAPFVTGRRAVILSDSNVFPLYGDIVKKSLESSGFTVGSAIFTAGEVQKNPQVLLSLMNEVGQFGLTRTDVVVALGGGVTGDMGGLLSALFLRGIACVQIPTSLLAMVDSSVGGKTAVNLPTGKNQMGTFTQPHLVLCDLDCLATLSPAVYAEGMAEIIKYGMIKSKDLLTQLQTGDIDREIEDIVAQCILIKREVVACDERDTGDRQLLNFGHTLGHAIEACGNYQFYHGEGVAIGMWIITRGAVAQGLCDPSCLSVLDVLLDKFNLPRTCEFTPEALLSAAQSDKKRDGAAITLVLPSIVGTAVLCKTDFNQLEALLRLGVAP